MQFNIEKYISNFIQSQFPSFYQEEGPIFIEFVKAYYEWLETEQNITYESRSLLDYRDIDNTVENFLVFFQKKYLYGIPFNVIINKRYLLKHILDVYRSKGSILCYKLLFRLIYDEDIEVYLPSQDVLRVSDGKWYEPRYLEVSKNDILPSYVGKMIQGVDSKTTAVVENYVKENYNTDITDTIYISNILPKGGDFLLGERIVFFGETSNNEAILAAPTIVGSLVDLNITNGGQNFNVGDILKIAQIDPVTQEYISYGVGGLFRVDSVKKAFGELNFDLVSGGFGFMANALCLVYKDPADNPISNASFNIFSIANTKTLTYNTDLIGDYANLSLNSVSFGFTGNVSANLSSNLEITLSFDTEIFGSIASLTNIDTGTGYSNSANVFVRTVQLSKNLPGSVSYANSSNIITGTNTNFTYMFSNNDVIYLRANSSLSSTGEYQVIKNVLSNTSIQLYGFPKYNSTASSIYKLAASIIPSNFASYEPSVYQVDGSVAGLNDNITAIPSSGNNIIDKVTVIDSGKAYNNGEKITTTGQGLIDFDIISSGFGYTSNAACFFYKNLADNPTSNASFSVFSLINNKSLEYNTDIICDYMDLQLDANTYNFTANVSANLTSTLDNTLSWANNIFGGIGGLGNINRGSDYTLPASAFIRSVQLSKAQPGTITYSNSSANVTGSGTEFTEIFANNDVVALIANSSNSSNLELHVIKQVVNNTLITLYGPANNNSTASSEYKVAPSILPSNFAYYEPSVATTNGTIAGLNTVISATPSPGTILTGINSSGERIVAYLSGGLTTPLVLNKGSGYTNGEIIQFFGGDYVTQANGYITTYSNGSISFATLINPGSDYTSIPVLKIKSSNGSGGILTTSIAEFNTFSKVRGVVTKGGIGKGKGKWKNEDGFLNSNKYIQDSYYYQDYSYEIRTGLALEKYKNVLLSTFHSSGSEFFGKLLYKFREQKKFEIQFEDDFIASAPPNTVDTVLITCDALEIICDKGL